MSRPLFASLALLVAFEAAVQPGFAGTAWIEGEAPTSANLDVNRSGWGKTELLSGGNWGSVSIDAGKVAETLPQDGGLLSYEFAVDAAGEHAVWGRIGFEFVRSPFEWRIGDGAWQRVEPSDYTTDLYELQTWAEIAWLQFGTANLTTGKHTLQIRLTPVQKDGKPDRILFAFDAACVTTERFRPNGKHKPGDAWQTDQDRAAAEQVFEFPSAGEARQELELHGRWQMARYDEQGEVVDRTGPVAPFPASADDLDWSSLDVPGDRRKQRPDLVFNHRYWLRTKIDVPADHAGKAFVLDFDEIGTFATVYVNGELMGHRDLPIAPWTLDVTRGIKPGQVNEIWVGIKDAYYAISDKGADTTRKAFNVPSNMLDENQGMGHRFDYTVKGHQDNGILDRVALVATGAVYVDDAYVKPLVSQGKLEIEYTLKNAGGSAAQATLRPQIVAHNGGDAVVTLKEATVSVPAGGQAKVRLDAPADRLELWWPENNPKLYDLVTQLGVGGENLDEHTARFGYREWKIDGGKFVLNGIPQQLRAGLDYNGAEPGEERTAVDFWREIGQNMFRLRFQRLWAGMTDLQAIRFFDEAGVNVRWAASTFDGQHASYGLVKDGKANAPLFDNWRRQLEARAREMRNSPSIFTWELDNEIVFINSRNFGTLDIVEPEFTKASRMLAELDPTRATVSGGGAALRDESLPTYGVHYYEVDIREYPDEAYVQEKSRRITNWNPWPVVLGKKPVFMSETFFYAGWSQDKLAAAGGEQAFLGRAEAREGGGILSRMLSEGYRWAGTGAFHFWVDSKNVNSAFHYAWQPVAALTREWNWTFGSGDTVTRTVKLFNDTRNADPITVRWELALDGASPVTGESVHNVKPGFDATFTVDLAVPRVSAVATGTFTLRCEQAGDEVYRHEYPVRVLPKDAVALPQVAAGELAVWDPQGGVAKRLQARGVAFQPVNSLEAVPATARVLIVGSDAVTPKLATDPAWLPLAASGKRVIVLDQKEPLRYTALTADVEPTGNTGRIAFPEVSDHRVFEGLDKADFFTWSGDHVVYRNAYRKATRGARSLVQCDDGLNNSALVESPVGDGLFLLSQLAIGGKLDKDPVAQHLFDNLVAYAFAYEKLARPVAVALPKDDPRAELLRRSGLKFDEAADALAAIEGGKHDVVVVDGSQATLATLTQNVDAVRSFQERGGWLVVHNVTPESLESFNELVGVDHLIRPFRQERVTLAPQSDPLASGLTQRDVVMFSGERIFGWVQDEFVSGDVFSHVVDLRDVAPFGVPAGAEKTVNGMTSADGWPYIYYMEGRPDGTFPTVTYTLARPETLTGLSIVPNPHYDRLRSIRVIFDGDESGSIELPIETYTADDNPRQDLAFDSPRQATKSVTIAAGKRDDISEREIVGIDNLWLHADRPADLDERVRPLTNVGGIVKYPLGEGGVLLNQLKVTGSETVPLNLDKKRGITATLLRNLGAGFSESRLVLPGEGLTYQPVSLDGKANLYLTGDRGWYDKNKDLRKLPVGRRAFAGVQYLIRDFATSPLESAVTLKGPGENGGRAPERVDGIAVGRSADALFFLHTLIRKDEWRPRNAADEAPVAFEYVVHYADGSQATVPVRLTRGVSHWLQKQPAGLPEASLAWTAEISGDESAAIYQMQWTNPKPEVAIQSVDLKYGSDGDKWGAPVLLAITTADAKD